ncbi:MAG TPA: universal stress protein [Propionibacteriaceae bacterium]|nr:universal stress protein [Propionibacteriaceae bacterium]
MKADRPLVFVGVNGSRAAREAVRWGAVEARLRRAQLLIGHVEGVAAHRLAAQAPRSSDDALLHSSAQVAAAMAPEIDVRTVWAVGSRVSTELLRLAERAQVIALGIDLTRRPPTHPVRGRLEDRVAVQAHCPVVTVAPGAFLMPGLREQVSVGWTDSRTALLALDAAAAEARLRNAPLNVVTVSPVLHPDVVGVIEPPVPEPALIDAIVDLRNRYPGLVIQISPTTGDVTAALSAVAVDAELLVLGAYHSDKPWSLRTGPVAAALTRLGYCPVMLVGRRAEHPARAVTAPAEQ